MTQTTTWKNRTAIVIGAGRSGVAAAELLVRCGATVTVTDLRVAADIPGIRRLSALRVGLALGGHPDVIWRTADAAIVSPGIALDAPPVRAARAHGLQVLSEIELAAPLASAPALAITGSNGKSTVTSMVGSILQRAGIKAAVCGNIGVPFSRLVKQQLDGERSVDVYVLELSSFQTEAIVDFHPHWAALLNISADHLDRHGEMGSYAEAKLRLTLNCNPEDWLVYGADDPLLRARIGTDAGAVTVPFSAQRVDSGPAAWVQDGQIFWRSPGGELTAVVAATEFHAMGAHNLLNACAAVALGCLAGASTEAAGEALRDFTGLEHRMEACGTIDGVECINDSKATNVGATLAALSGLERTVWLILGGRDKDSDFARLRPVMSERVRRVLLVGEASGKIAASLRGAVPMEPCGHLERAVDAALEQAAPGDVVLLAPACTSFDQYDDFEQRGKHFKALVAARVAARQAGAPTMGQR